MKAYAARTLSMKAALLTATVLSCVSAVHAQGVSAVAAETSDAAPDSAAPENRAGKDIVVTGSRIRGVAPTGSAVVGLDRKDMERLPVSSTTDILRQLPMVTSLGADEGTSHAGSSVQGASANNTLARAANLRGFGTTATLVLIDGHRVAPQGVSGQISDLDVIPALAVERVEVVADGASAIYGSDAVAGVINVILRKRYNGLRAMGRVGLAEDYRQAQGSVAGGTTWDTGSITATYEYTYRSRLQASKRPGLFSTDFSPYGGSPASQISYPGNVLIGGQSYPILPGQSGANFTLADLGTRGVINTLDGWSGLDALPRQERHSGLVYAEQELTDSIKLFAEGIYTHRTYRRMGAPAAGSATGYAVPSSNPFSPCAAGKSTTNTQGIVCPTNGTVNVQYSFLNDLGPAILSGVSELWSARTGAEIDLGRSWKATVAGGISKATDNSNSTNNINATAVTAAINGTATLNSGGISTTVTRPVSVPALNLFCGAPITCNSQATLDYIRGGYERPASQLLKYISFGADGALFDLPGGAVRLAVGGDLRWDKQKNNNIQNTVAASNTYWTENPTTATRDVQSFYGELFVPVVGAGNAMPGIERLSLSLALRTEKYSDFGRTTNPKIGVTWETIPGLNLRASYGTSFRAPTLGDTNPNAAAIARAQALTSAQSTGLGVPTSPASSFVLVTGGTLGLQPEKATTWSLGMDFRPQFAPGLYVSLNYYNVTYSNRIDQPLQNAGSLVALQSAPLYDEYIIYNPTFFPTKATLTQTAFNAAVQAIYDGSSPVFSGNTAPVNTVVAITQGKKFNAGKLKTSGLDFATNYTFDSGVGQWRLGVSGTYVFRYVNQITPTATPIDVVNQFSAVGAPLRFRARGDIGWSNDTWAVSTFYNFSNSYSLTPQQLPAGISTRYLKVRARLTVDGTINYRFPDNDGGLKGVSLQLNAQNLLNDKPPFMINNGATPVLFDPSNASPLGRLISLQITKDF